MRHDVSAESLEQFVAERGQRLLRVAVLLTGTREAGEDLLQAALERLLRHWRRIDGDPEGYLRRMLYNLAADGWRRHGLWQTKRVMLVSPPAADATDAVDIRDAVVRLLLQLPDRQRAVIVLRYFEQLSEAEAAAVLGCSVGAVKSASSRGLARMRKLAGEWHEDDYPASRR
ncbi:MAG: SigE family RNA polymerase sigma factor [Actinomycetota bacterium]|nr:SigE family RNA polymerase sigma factor [Actinomycetota bacterium]